MENSSLQNLIYLISRLPGIGTKSAQRIALYLAKHQNDLMLPLAEEITKSAKSIKTCKICGMIDTKLPTNICSSEQRDRKTICIVEDMADVWAIERSGHFRGIYHVLGGLLSASKNFQESDLRLEVLKKRIDEFKSQEIILALSATIEGRSTSFVIKEKLENLNLQITQLAYGMPVGSEIHYLDESTLGAAIDSRKDF